MMNRHSFERAVVWAAGQGASEITLLGGEPSLHPEFADLLQIVADAGLKNRIVSNGARQFRQLLADGLLQDRGVAKVAVSLDTVDRVLQNHLRGPRAYEDATETVAMLVERSMVFDINVTATVEVIKRLDDLLAYADEHGCRRVNVHWPSEMGMGEDLADQVPTKEQWLQLVSEMEQWVPTISSTFIEIERGYLDSQPLKQCALVAPTNIQIFPDGRVILCGLGADRDDWPAIRLGPQGLERLGAPGIENELLSAARYGCASCPAVGEEDRACIYDKVQSAPTSSSA
jgi:MoaA/NifB/PqqE/SkfB family radical SAM enzyme